MASNFDIYNVIQSIKVGNRSLETVLDTVGNEFPFLKHMCEGSDAKKFYCKLTRIHKRISTLTKNKALEKNKIFVHSQFVFEVSNVDIDVEHTADGHVTGVALTHSENEKLKRKIVQVELQNKELENALVTAEAKYEQALQEMKNLVSETESVSATSKELSQLKLKYDKLSQNLDMVTENLVTTKEKLSNLSTRNYNKRIKRREEKIAEQKSKISEMENEIDNLNDALASVSLNLQESESCTSKLRNEKEKLKKKIYYFNSRRVQESYSKLDPQPCEIEVDVLRQQVNELEKRNEELEELYTLYEDPEIVTFQDGKYTDEVRETIYELLGMNISINKVNEVIKTVLKKLANKEVGKLPSKALKSRLAVEANILAKIHVAEAMQSDTAPSSLTGNCLHGDGTTKFHRHYQNFQVTLLNGETMSVGLREMGASDSSTILKTFVSLVHDLKDALPHVKTDEEKKKVAASLITSIKNTMSDQGSVNPCFNRQLQILRESLLPDVIRDWEKLTEETKSNISSMGNYFCKMHILVNFATEANNMLQAFEQIACNTSENSSVFRQNESGAARLIRTACKAFHPRGSDEAGVASHFKAFLDGKDCNSKLAPFVGNRFNILFYNAAAVYYHIDHISEFLDKWPNQNKLLQAVAHDVKNKVNLAGVRALGIIDKIITGPYWRLIEKTKSILDLNAHLLKMRDCLEKWASDASSLLAGEEMFNDVCIHNDEVYNKIFLESDDVEFESLTQQALEVLMNGLLILLERQAQDQLPGGKYFDVDPVAKNSANNVPPTNKASESDFAILDMLIRFKPSATVLHHEMITMWLNNKTSKWLNSKTAHEKSQLISSAMSQADKAIQLHKLRNVEIKQIRKENLELKQKSKEESLDRERVNLVNLTQKLGKFGNLWTSADEVDSNVANLLHKPKELHEALKTQITFQKTVLKSKGNKELFHFSETRNEKRVHFDNKKLCENLREIIRLNPVCSVEEIATSSDANEVTPQAERADAVNEMKMKLSNKLKEGREKRLIDAQKTKLPLLLNDPQKLIGCRIKHKCFIDEKRDSFMWYDAKVTDIKTMNDNPFKIEYFVEYEDDEIWYFPLLTDVKKGDLIICDDF